MRLEFVPVKILKEEMTTIAATQEKQKGTIKNNKWRLSYRLSTTSTPVQLLWTTNDRPALAPSFADLRKRLGCWHIETSMVHLGNHCQSFIKLPWLRSANSILWSPNVLKPFPYPACPEGEGRMTWQLSAVWSGKCLFWWQPSLNFFPWPSELKDSLDALQDLRKFIGPACANSISFQCLECFIQI